MEPPAKHAFSLLIFILNQNLSSAVIYLLFIFVENCNAMTIDQLLLPVHKISVITFLLIYVVKTTLLLAKKPSALKSFTRATKVIEMLVSVLFLVTGVWMLAETGTASTLQIIKFLCVLVAIPLAIVGFKKEKKPLAIASLVLIIAAYGLAEVNKKQKEKNAGTATVSETTAVETNPDMEGYDKVKHGGFVYKELNCAMCHGQKGDATLNDAKDLTITTLDEAAIKDVVKNGRMKMPAFAGITDVQNDALAAYIKSLKKE